MTLLLRAGPLTMEGFARFGDVLAHGGVGRRAHFPGALEAPGPAPRPALWVSRVTAPSALPLRVDRMERHRHAAQSFIPLDARRWLVVVAPDLRDGGPDPHGAVAFLAGPHAGVCYRPGVWHGSMAVLDAPAGFVVLMSDAGHPDDDEFRPIHPVLEVTA